MIDSFRYRITDPFHRFINIFWCNMHGNKFFINIFRNIFQRFFSKNIMNDRWNRNYRWNTNCKNWNTNRMLCNLISMISNKEQPTTSTKSDTAVKTGDSTNILLWSMVMVISLAGMLTALFFKRRRNR